jgi:hypothetical protein
MHAGRARKDFDRGAALRIEAGVVGDEADVLTAEWRKLLRFQDVDACLHAARAAGAFGGSGGVKGVAKRKCECEPGGQLAAGETVSMRCSGAVHGVSGKFNDILERSVCGCVVEVMCVCYIQAKNAGEKPGIFIQ